jgi:cyclomaltodextrinase / maltogenic alpha-amylase / neopullulanase
MEGGRDPDNRRMMVWDKTKWNQDVFQLYQKLIQIRKENELLRSGDFRFIYAKDMVIGYERFLDDQKLVVFINNSDENAHIDITKIFGNGDFIDITKDHPLKRKKAYTLYSYEAVILKKMKSR